MCGFVAYVGKDAPSRAGLAGRLAERLRQRGPDDAGLHQAAGAVLAHRRLSIIDVAGGRQPLLGEDDRVALVCNGEIYNHQALRAQLAGRHRFRSRSDSEVILHLYEEKGPACVADLDGMFAFVLSDGERFLAARDPLGIKPLYLGRAPEGGVWFASELKALPDACRELEELPPGCLVTERGVIERWFTPPWVTVPAEPTPADLSNLAGRLEDAVTKRLMSEVPLGVFLSGGLDSSIIAALVRRHVPGLHSFAVGVDGAPDLLCARRVARHLGTNHHEIVYSAADAIAALPDVITHLESYDPALIRSAVPCYFVSKLAARRVKVVLSGEGSDEIFAGYGYMKHIHDPAALHRECVRLLLGLHNMNLQRVDRMTMAHALEGRVPFLDVGFLAAAMALDPAEKLHQRGRPEKWLLRRACADLLPEEILWRPKQEFAAGAGSEGIFADHAEDVVRAADVERATERFPIDPPASKEELLFRQIFHDRFPGDAARRTVGRWRGSATVAPPRS